MDYIQAYNKVIEAHTAQTDFINFVDNKLSELKLNDLELERDAEQVRKVLDEFKIIQTEYLRRLHLKEIQLHLRGGLK